VRWQWQSFNHTASLFNFLHIHHATYSMRIEIGLLAVIV
jgi:hypothetical protein